jgi:hypothetical protein
MQAHQSKLMLDQRMFNEFNRHDALLMIIESPDESGSLKQNVAQCQVSCMPRGWMGSKRSLATRATADGSPKAFDLNERIFIVLPDWQSALHRSAWVVLGYRHLPDDRMVLPVCKFFDLRVIAVIGVDTNLQ